MLNPKKLLNKIFPNSKIISPLLGGMMNLSFIIENNNKKYVLYIPSKQANKMVNRIKEKEDQLIAHNLSITSLNYYFDEKSGIKINEYIDGVSLNEVEQIDYQKVSNLLHLLHSSKKLSKSNYDCFNILANYRKQVSKFLKFNEEYLFLEYILLSNQDFLTSQKKVFSHNDAQRSNFIVDKNNNYYLIDFEFTGNNDEIYDIAAFANNNLDDGIKLLNKYFTKPNKQQYRRFYLWRIFISLQWYLVALIKHHHKQDKKYGYDFIKVADNFLNLAMQAYAKFLNM